MTEKQRLYRMNKYNNIVKAVDPDIEAYISPFDDTTSMIILPSVILEDMMDLEMQIQMLNQLKKALQEAKNAARTSKRRNN